MMLLLIRHALTARTGVRLSGWTPGVSLDRRGRAQAASLAERLRGTHIDAIYASPLERTVQTAEPIARAHGLRVRKREDLGEVQYGEIEGKSLKSLARTKIWVHLRAWPSDVHFPGGESIRQTQVRAVDSIERLRTEHPGQVVAVVSHADWIKLALAHYLGVHIDLYRRLMIEPASVSAIQFFDMGVAIRRVNDTGDLGDLAPVTTPTTRRAATR